MKQKCTVVLLSTKDRTDIVFTGGLLKYKVNKGLADVSQHLYITVSQEVEPIKEGDWCIRLEDNHIWKVDTDIKIINRLAKVKGWRKIVATTDNNLFTGEDIIPHTSLPMISQQFIKEYVDKGGIDTVRDELIIYKFTAEKYE